MRNFCTNLLFADFWSGSFEVQWPWKSQCLHWIFPRGTRKRVKRLCRFSLHSVCHLNPLERQNPQWPDSKTNYRIKWSQLKSPQNPDICMSCVLLSPLERVINWKPVGNTGQNPSHISNLLWTRDFASSDPGSPGRPGQGSTAPNKNNLHQFNRPEVVPQE